MFSALLLAQLAVLAPGGTDPLDAKEKFLAAYEPAARSTSERLSKNWQLVVHGTFFEDGKPATKETYEFLANDRCILLKETLELTKPEARTSVTWRLLRPDGVYEIGEARRPGEYILKKRFLGEHSASDFSRAPFWIMTIPVMRFGHFLPSHIKKPETRVLQFGETLKDGMRLRELKVAETVNQFSSIATFYFHATDDWLLHSFEVEGSERVMVRYQYQSVGEEQVPKRVEVHLIDPGGISKPRSVLEYESYQRVDPPEAEFSLEKFGLPESVNFAPRRSTPPYVWILAIAAGCAALALLFRFLARRRVVTAST